MSIKTSFEIQFLSNSVTETQSLGLNLGKHIDSKTIIALSGDLGSGKTAFVQGVAKGLDVPEDYYITSPTYTLLNEYSGRFPLYHFDFYRLENVEDIFSTGFYEILDMDNAVIAIEWANKLHEDINQNYLKMHFFIRENDARSIHITAIGDKPVQLIRKIQIYGLR